MRIFLFILLSLVTAEASQAANTEPSTPPGTESLDGRLLEGLSPDAIQPNSSPQAVQPTKPAIAAPAIGGFGVGPNPASQPLMRVQHNMQHAELLLTQPGNHDSTGPLRLAATVQLEVLSDLDKLIAELSKQCQCNGGQCPGGKSQGDKPPKPGSKPGKPGVAAGKGQSAARDSTDRLDRTTAKSVAKGDVDELVKALWGQLPARSREQMVQSFSDEFLPKYELEIEQYYQRLSDEQNKGNVK
jgi:hypothetical protein